MVAEENGLCPLQVGVAGHNNGFIFLRLLHNGLDHRLHQIGNFINLASQIHPDIQSDLVVTASGGVELFAHISNTLGKHLLHKHMNIFAGWIDHQHTGVQILQNALQTVDQKICIILRDDTLTGQHCRVGHRAGDIFFIHSGIKPDRRIKIICYFVCYAGSYTGPHFRHNFELPSSAQAAIS